MQKEVLIFSSWALVDHLMQPQGEQCFRSQCPIPGMFSWNPTWPSCAGQSLWKPGGLLSSEQTLRNLTITCF